MENKKTLIFFTGSFPYLDLNEQSFILPELDILSECFKKVIIIPLAAQRERVSLEKYKNIETDVTFASSILQTDWDSKFSGFLSILFSIRLLQSLIQDKSYKSRSKISVTLHQLYYANRVKKWLKAFFSSTRKDEEFVLYTYWFDYATLACARFSDRRIKNKITRAHGYDVYDFAVAFRSAYWRKYVLSKIDGVYVVSQEGMNYLKKKFPEYQDKIFRMYLGTKRKSDVLTKTDAGVLNIFSCSYMTAVKRNDLLARYIIAFAEAFPDFSIVWTHAGGGPLLEMVQQIVEEHPLQNLQVIFMGSVDHQVVIDYYAHQAVDVFVSLTKSEGLPVSMMEAQSFGVPIVSTNVGGIAEIVIEGETGFLLNANPAPNDFISKMGFFLRTKENRQMQLNCYKNWAKNFDATKNHKLFVSEIQKC